MRTKSSRVSNEKFNGNAYDKVYKKYDTTGKEFLYHTAGKDAPFVKKEEDDLEGVLKKRIEKNIYSR